MNTAELHKVYSLSQLTQSVENLLRPQFTKRYWIKAEMNRLNYHARTGGCYPDLIEKKDNQVIAQLRAVLWKRNFDRINALFLQTLKEPLKDGSELLLEVSIHFDAVRGLNLFIHDISIEFAIGQLEKQRAATEAQLKAEGLLEKNKAIPFPLLPKRIAIISEQTSDGFLDFIQVLKHSRWSDSFFIHLFPAILQGDGAIRSIPLQLKRIEAVSKHFDLVAIVRGGGSDLDMNCYNSYEIAASIANCKLAVLTGIGHSTNMTLSELVAHKNGITPTALASSLVEHLDRIWEPIQAAKNILIKRSNPIISASNQNIENSQKWLHLKGKSTIDRFSHILDEKEIELENSMRFRNRIEMERVNSFLQVLRMASRYPKEQLENYTLIMHRFKHLISRYTHSENQELLKWSSELTSLSSSVLEGNTKDLVEFKHSVSKYVHQKIEKELDTTNKDARFIKLADPKNMLERGFTISRMNGKVLTSKEELANGLLIETEWKEGKFLSRIELNKEDKK